jgi:hypothetical protein
VRVALARRTPQSAATEEDGNVTPQRGYGAPPRYVEPARPRYGEVPRPYYVQPYGEPYYARRPPSPYAPPPGYYEPQPYPRYYRW